MHKTRVVTRRRLALLAAPPSTVAAAATPTPAQAVSGVIVTQSTPIYLGVTDYRVSNDRRSPSPRAAPPTSTPPPSTSPTTTAPSPTSPWTSTVSTPTTSRVSTCCWSPPTGVERVAPGPRRRRQRLQRPPLVRRQPGRRDPGRRPRTGPQPGPAVRLRDPWHTSSPAPGLTGDTALSTFDGAVADGDWDLYVYDDDGKAASIDGWTLDLRLVATPYPSQLTVGAPPGSVVTDVDVSLHLTTEYADDTEPPAGGSPGAAHHADVRRRGDPREQPLVAHRHHHRRRGAGGVPGRRPDRGRLLPADQRRRRGRRLPVAGAEPHRHSCTDVFDGTAPQGTWRLFAYDPFEEDLVQVDDWTLDIEYVEKVAPSGSVSIAGGAAGTRTRERHAEPVGHRPPAGLGDQRHAPQQRRDDVLGVPVLRRHPPVDPHARGRHQDRLRAVPRRRRQPLAGRLGHDRPRHHRADGPQGPPEERCRRRRTGRHHQDVVQRGPRRGHGHEGERRCSRPTVTG